VTAAKKQAVRQQYIEGLGALRSLAGRHGIPLSTLQRWSATEHWPALRREHELFKLGKLCPSQAPAIALSTPLENADEADVMEKRRTMALRVVEEQIRLLLQRQKESQDQKERFTVSSLLGEHTERLLRMAGLIPRPAPQNAKRGSKALPMPQLVIGLASDPEPVPLREPEPEPAVPSDLPANSV
jgi:transposase-like protein